MSRIRFRTIAKARAAAVVVTIGILASPTVTIHKWHQYPPHSVWDSVYSVEQAARGDTAYKKTCVRCHGASLTGGEEALPLSGNAFLSNWNGLPLSDLYERIRNSMPPDKPKTVGKQDLADILAYLLSQNQFPAGQTELANDPAFLKDIKIEQTRPTP